MLLLFLFFCLCCRAWAAAKVNYVFIFEFDTRHNLDWRQLSEVSYSDNLCDLADLELATMFLPLLTRILHVAQLHTLWR